MCTTRTRPRTKVGQSYAAYVRLPFPAHRGRAAIRYWVANLLGSEQQRNYRIGAVPMEKDYLILKRASASRTSGQWKEDDFDVLADGVVVGRIMKAAAPPVDAPWLWTLAFGHHGDRTPTRWAPRSGGSRSRWAPAAALAPRAATPPRRRGM